MADQPQFLNKINPKGQDDKPKKIIFYGDSPTCATGFGQVSRNILPYLQASGRYQVDILGINYWGDPHNYPFPIWPMAVNGQKDPYGRQRLQQHLLDPNLQYDYLFFLQDTFILEFLPNLLTTLKNAGKEFKSVFYFPIDGVPKQTWIEAAAAVDYPITYSQFAYDESVKLVPSLEDRLRIIPHGFNPKVFFPAPEEDVKSFRQQYFGALADKFIVTNVNRNQQRKDIPATIRAFMAFKEKRPDSVLYLHMMAKDQGWNLPEVLSGFGLDMSKDVILPQKFTASTGFPLEILNLIYNASDAIVSTTVGEGWGLSWTEAMATKTPVVFPQNTCLTEYITEENGWPYPSGGDMDHITVIPNDNEVPRPTAHIHKMVDQLVALHDNPEEGKRRAQVAYEMLHNNLIWDTHINPQWLKLFDSIQTGAAAPKETTSSTLRGDLL